MEFRTELQPDQFPVSLRLTDRVVTIGSCFAEVMGQALADHKIHTLNNPFGTLFNPVSMVKLLLSALNEAEPDPDLFLERDGLWFHYDFHSSFAAPTREGLETQLRQCLTTTGEALRSADWLLLTLGTAVVYRHRQTDKVVSNCHKMPGQLFEKYLYAYEHLHESLTLLMRKLRRINSSLQVVLTVSPVRHTKDTLPVNGASKALLRAVCHELSVWHEPVHYFPAYEILLDDLRDYRFYEADLVHPNTQARQYLFEKFAESAFDAELRAFVAEWQGIRRGLAHRPFHAGTPSHRRFLEKLLGQLDALAGRVDVANERAAVQQQLEIRSGIEARAN